MDQYTSSVLSILGQNIGVAQKFSSILNFLRGPESAAYWSALSALAQQHGIDTSNQSTMITQLMQMPATTWTQVAAPVTPTMPTTADKTPVGQGTLTTNQFTPDYIENMLKSQITYEGKIKLLYDAMDSPDQVQVWSAIEQLAAKYGVQTGRTVRETIDSLSGILIPKGWPPEYYPTPVTPEPPQTGYGPPSWIEPFSNLLSTPYSNNTEDYFRWMQGFQGLLQQHPDALGVLSDTLRQQGINNGEVITTPEGLANALWNSDYNTRLNVVANFGGNPQPAQPTAVGAVTYTAPQTPQAQVVQPPSNPPTDSTATVETDRLAEYVGKPWRAAMQDLLNNPKDLMKWMALTSTIEANPSYLAEVQGFLTQNGITGNTASLADLAQTVWNLPTEQNTSLLAALTTETPETAWTSPRGQTAVPNQPWARTPGYWQGGEWIPTGSYSPTVEYQETMNALLPWMSPMDQNTYAQYLSGAQPEIYGSQGGKGYGDLSSQNIPRLNPYEAYQYDTSNRVQSARETMMDPWGEGQQALIDPDSPVRNWVDAVLREAGRYSPGGQNVNAGRRTREQQSLYDDTLSNLLGEQGAASFGVNDNYVIDQATGKTAPLYSMWSNWLSSFLAPTQFQEPVSQKASVPAWRQNQYVQGQYGSNRGYGYTNTRWS